MTQWGYVHSTVCYAVGEFARDEDGDGHHEVHVNTIEGFWSLVKRGLDGVYHSVSRQHLQGYLNEYCWRYNQRLEPRTRFRALILRTTFL